MKFEFFISLLLVTSAFGQEKAVVAVPQEDVLTLTPKKAAAMTERLTSDELNKKKAAANSSISNAKFKPVEDGPAYEPVKVDLYKDAEIITDGGMHTILPPGSVLSYPEGLANRIVSKATGAFVFWPDFYAKNKSWISLQEVDVATAKGEVPLSEKLIKVLQSEAKMTVAVYKGNPVSVLEYKEPEAVEQPKK